MQVIHITGKLDWQLIEKARVNLTNDELQRYRPYPYLYDEMGAAMRLADLALTRAGASTLGELPVFGLPAVLVPYPYAWRYQRVNASYLTRHGAAIQIEDSKLASEIVSRVTELIADKERLAEMSKAMQALAQPDAASRIAGLLSSLSTTPSQGGDINVPKATD
jgi:UDP-N-acetylglucosamine--N-acetylmuramyl-(pentapeptide) pyrophosphoryl-undecaprenol N-acetylglucosamine transferase